MAAPFPSPTGTWHTKEQPSGSPSRPEVSAKGKNVLITGGGTGIGAETARYFAQAGAPRIALLGRRKQPMLDTKASLQKEFPNLDVFVASTDITKKDDVDKAFADFVGAGKLNVLVSNAAMIGPQESVGEADAGKFVDAIQQNISGAVNVAQAFLRHATEDAVVVEINSSAAHVNFAPKFSAYSVAKLAVFRLWDSLAFANPGLSVFHVQPGIVNTDMNKEAGGVEAIGFEDHVSLPASFSLWLASPEARFLKNKYLWANWDIEELRRRAEELEAGPQLSIGLVGWPFQDRDWKVQLAPGKW
ncbi:uncharacterized protein LTR77_009398 [Saxophila tyrrhenica]|uniref:Ketoreductase domain-containing protein n=1 Tax=Saxophila tyrrhenica TaxID=1690608 RepID=A0AAV9P2S1_9PEZI|nr:hypothetical protein LTR77_009398 [Saxophila tyrrhenica]